MTPTGIAVILMVAAWCLLTLSLLLLHIADRDGWRSVLWALMPTVVVVGLAYASTFRPLIETRYLPIAIGGGFLVLTGVLALKSWRRVRALRRRRR